MAKICLGRLMHKLLQQAIKDKEDKLIHSKIILEQHPNTLRAINIITMDKGFLNRDHSSMI